MEEGMPSADIEIVLKSQPRDIGGFPVRRALPRRQRRMVGPFIFFDQMGPELLAPGRGVEVRPHPHIGLSTVTYLFAGSLLHRDSLGTVQRIEPGEVNWMTAGQGIVHSERTAPEDRDSPQDLFGLQIWVALPRRLEETAPSFAHYAASTVPEYVSTEHRLRVIVGSVDELTSPVEAFSPTLYAEVRLAPSGRFKLPTEYEERAVYVVEGSVRCGADRVVSAGSLAVFGTGEILLSTEDQPAHLMLIGGDRLDGERFVEWNFVSSSKERIAQAKDDWLHQRFAKVPGETEFIPLPGAGRREVAYP
jgi:redox-sensitive bicupin YhaK (pirin superfamily)